MLRDKPIIKQLNYTKEEIAEVKRIQSEEVHTKKKEAIRNVLQGPMCCVDNEIPTKRVEYNIPGVMRIECYCEKCFENIYQRNKEISLRDIAKTYNCTIAPPGSMSKIKIQGYSETAKSSLASIYGCIKAKEKC